MSLWAPKYLPLASAAAGSPHCCRERKTEGLKFNSSTAEKFCHALRLLVLHCASDLCSQTQTTGRKQRKKIPQIISVHSLFLCYLWSFVQGSQGCSWSVCVCDFPPLFAAHTVRPRTQPSALDFWDWWAFSLCFPLSRQCCSVQQLVGVGKLYSNKRDIPVCPPGEGVYVLGIFPLFAVWLFMKWLCR